VSSCFVADRDSTSEQDTVRLIIPAALQHLTAMPAALRHAIRPPVRVWLVGGAGVLFDWRRISEPQTGMLLECHAVGDTVVSLLIRLAPIGSTPPMRWWRRAMAAGLCSPTVLAPVVAGTAGATQPQRQRSGAVSVDRAGRALPRRPTGPDRVFCLHADRIAGDRARRAQEASRRALQETG
jgi:hypothetical protein